MKALFPVCLLLVASPVHPQSPCAVLEAVTVKIQGAETGAGILLQSDGKTAWIATAKHLVPRASRISVLFSKNSSAPVPATLELELAGLDAAVIKAVSARGDLPKSTVHVRTEEIQKGERVSFVGHPAGQDWQCYLGKDVISRLTYEQDDRLFLFSDPIAQKGTSGGPVFDQLGNVIGLITRHSPLGNTVAMRIGPITRVMSDELNVAISSQGTQSAQANAACNQGCEIKLSDLKFSKAYPSYDCLNGLSCTEIVYEFPKEWPGARFLHYLKMNMQGVGLLLERLDLAGTDRIGDSDAPGHLSNGVGQAVFLKEGRVFSYKFYRAPGSESIVIQLQPTNSNGPYPGLGR